MRIHRDHAGLPAPARGASVAIGNFDGVHRGHREVIRVAAQHAREMGRPLGVLTFEPHPREVLTPAAAPARLTPLRRKAEILRGLGVERLHVLRFDERLMRVSAASFVTDILLGELGVAAITTGRDFRFGHKRQGDTALLAAIAREHRLRVSAVDPVTVDGEVCSSTAIRAALADGRVEHAAAMLAGKPGILHGQRSYLLQDEDGQVIEPHSISAGLDYPGIGPELSWLKDQGRLEVAAIRDDEALAAFSLCARLEGILPALEPCHALAQVAKLAPMLERDRIVLMNLCGRGDKDVFTVGKVMGVDL